MPKNYRLIFLFLFVIVLIGCGGNSRSKTPPPNTNPPSETTPPNTTQTHDTTATQDTSNTNTAQITESSQATIDVLVLYDREAQSSYANINTRINHLFAVTNNIYADSRVNIKVNVKKIAFFDAQKYPALDEISSSSSVQALREKYKADTVLLYQVNPDGEFGLCGTAYGASSYAQTSHFKDAMFAQVAINCPTDSTAHELGHNMGLLHSHKQNGNNAAPYPYGLGHGVDGKFATVMAYAHNFSTNNQIARFSSPAYECIPGYPCGIAIGQNGEAHATKVLEITAPKIANLY